MNDNKKHVFLIKENKNLSKFQEVQLNCSSHLVISSSYHKFAKHTYTSGSHHTGIFSVQSSLLEAVGALAGCLGPLRRSNAEHSGIVVDDHIFELLRRDNNELAAFLNGI